MLITLNDSNKSFDRIIVETLGLLVPRLENLCIKTLSYFKHVGAFLCFNV